ncbi:S-locus-specific glycoprotein S13-like [Alnus glutinosa]|uniref:S-locus-specific glycoprotein S13-like n=1 Tax=Alnus glutinosa TaxID=3517 RepID=UPI002D778CD1|nr:S-locus-specific glycoprotein S13-like [Alnus glutinosa]
MSNKTVVWDANRNTPLSNSSGTFKIGDHGNVVVVDQVGNISWSSNETKAGQHVVQLLDSGNLVVKEMNESDPGKYLWQSFDYPTDTLLPDMKLGWELDTGFDRHLTSWRSSADPSTGDYSFKLDFREKFLVEQTRSRISKQALERDKVQRGTRNGAFKLSQL